MSPTPVSCLRTHGQRSHGQEIRRDLPKESDTAGQLEGTRMHIGTFYKWNQSTCLCDWLVSFLTHLPSSSML